MKKMVEKVGDRALGPPLHLNPIENLWHILHSKIRKRRPKILKKEDLIYALVEEWEKLYIAVVNHLINSMLHRLQVVIDIKGHSTKY
jgi:hypothetical protein